MKKILAIMVVAAGLASCGNSAKEKALAEQQALVKVRDSIRLDSLNKAQVAEKEAEKERIAEERHQEELLAARRAGARSARSSSYSSSGTTTSSSAGTTTAAKKKGWSDAAKGTAIGAGAGAIGGALIDKKSGRGAIIGGLAGAGAGYVIGRSQDRKSGRVQPSN